MNFAGFEGLFAFHSSSIFVFGSEGSDELELLHRDVKDWVDSWSWLEDGFCVASDVRSKCGGSALNGLVEFWMVTLLWRASWAQHRMVSSWLWAGFASSFTRLRFDGGQSVCAETDRCREYVYLITISTTLPPFWW